MIPPAVILFVAVASLVTALPQASPSPLTSSASISSASITPSPTIAANATSSASSSAPTPSLSVFPPPVGGLGITPEAMYQPMSDYDVQSLNLALIQEYLELDLFNRGLTTFSSQDFQNAGLSPDDVALLRFMAQQEIGHAQLITNIIGNATQSCTFNYTFGSVRDFIDTSMKVTRIGESGVVGFLEHLNSRGAANLVLQAITTESRQQMIFRQFEGLFPEPFYFVPAITQSMQWTLMAPFITSCPNTNTPVQWQNFPALNVENAPNVSVLTNQSFPAISHNASAKSFPGAQLNLTWELPGRQIGPNNTYTTVTTAGTPRFVAWISQLNTTYTPLENINGTTGTTTQPGGPIFNDTFSTPSGVGTSQLINGTVFLVITDDNPFVTPFNLSQLNQHVVAGPALYVVD